MKLNEKIFEYRKLKGWSQEELAEKLDVSRQTVSKWEIGNAVPEIAKLIKLSEIYNITVDELVKEDAEITNNTNDKNNIISEESNDKTKNRKKQVDKKRIFKFILVVLFVIIFIILLAMIIILNKRESLIREIAQVYKDNFGNIGITNSGYIVEESVKKADGIDFETIKKEYYYYVTNESKLLRMRVFENNSDIATKEVYVDLSKEIGMDRYNGVTEIDVNAGTYRIIDNYELVSPVKKMNMALNNWYSVIGNDVFSAKEVAKDFENDLSKVKHDDGFYLYLWKNSFVGIEEPKDKIELILEDNRRCSVFFDNDTNDIKSAREILDVVALNKDVLKEEVEMPNLDEYINLTNN